MDGDGFTSVELAARIVPTDPEHAPDQTELTRRPWSRSASKLNWPKLISGKPTTDRTGEI